MLKNFNDTSRLSNLGVLDDLLFKVGGANFFHVSGLFYFLTLIEVLKFAIEELFDQLVQVFANLVEEHNFSVLMNIRVRVILFILLITFFITLSNKRLGRL